MPHGIRGRLVAGLIEPCDLVRTQCPTDGTEVVDELCFVASADDHARNAGPLQEPVERDLGDGLAGFRAHDVERVDDAEESLLVVVRSGAGDVMRAHPVAHPGVELHVQRILHRAIIGGDEVMGVLAVEADLGARLAATHRVLGLVAVGKRRLHAEDGVDHGLTQPDLLQCALHQCLLELEADLRTQGFAFFTDQGRAVLEQLFRFGNQAYASLPLLIIGKIILPGQSLPPDLNL